MNPNWAEEDIEWGTFSHTANISGQVVAKASVKIKVEVFSTLKTHMVIFSETLLAT